MTRSLANSQFPIRLLEPLVPGGFHLLLALHDLRPIDSSPPPAQYIRASFSQARERNSLDPLVSRLIALAQPD
ncbi:hypothetical protein BofuT4_uP020580.1 [Botrytis cinerea T4]|uniref:Uncharacterized protein n=1 Tax=Botryotinia fuckeliana (strain T4) TaxID=999810 RepID=G2YJ65_BOTF4|nr:hypothetical protein BofuT4_uP020580.1 [Botrytis cinerea T4]